MYSAYSGYYDRGCRWENPATFSAFSLEYWERSFFQRMQHVFQFDGLPENWDKDAFLYGLFRLGFLAVFESRRYGVVFQPASPAGLGLFYQPTGLTVSSPYFSFSRPLTIGEETEPIKLTPDYRGIWDLISKYAREMQLLDIACRSSSINARFAYVLAATDDNGKKSMDYLMEKIANGDPSVVYDVRLRTNKQTGEQSVPWEQFDRDLKKNFILPELQDCQRTVITNFYREIGVRIAPDKKERISIPENESYDAETFNRRTVWKSTLDESIRRVNAMFGTGITIAVNDPAETEGGAEDVTESDR